jgi:uncharacterized protein Yka (UPF0111/DUF47 family)
MAELRIPIVVENKGKKALKDVDKGITGLTKNFRKLAGAAGIGLSTAAVINFGKKAASAFIADEKAANRLAISVKNLGLGFETPRIERYIAELSALSGVTDDELRPSMQKLLQTVGSVTKAQELLALATNISAGSGVDYETVVNDLSRAYVGQTRGLTKYALGVSVAELKTMQFAEVQERLNKQFSGANAAYLETYAGKLQLITTAAGEASETIGQSLVESLVAVFAAGDTTNFVNQIDTLANKIADTVAAVVFGFQKLYVLTSDRAILASFNPFDDYEKNALAAIEAAEKAAKFRRNLPSMGYQGSQAMGIYETTAQVAARKKAESDAIKRAKVLADLQKKSLAEAKKKTALEKASGVLDLERIGIASALKGQISETDRLSLNLQLALLDKNDSQATKLAGQLATATKNNADLQAALIATPEAPNPWRNWKVPDMGPLGGLPAGVIAGVTPNAPSTPSMITVPEPPAFNVPQYAPDSYTQFGPLGGLGAGVIAGVNPQPTINITVELDGETVGGAIRNGSINDSLSGSFNTVNRSGFKGAVAV